LSRDVLRADFRRVRPSDMRVVLIEAGDRVLPPFEPALSERARRQLQALGVEVRTGVRVEEINAQGVRADGSFVAAGTVLWGAGVRPSPLTEALGAPRDRAGRVLVEPDCSIPGHREVFVIGDMASLTPAGESAPLPGISPVAMQQGRATAANILRAVEGRDSRPFRYFDKGFMATIGRARAVAKLGPLRLWGLPAWLAWVMIHLWYLIGFRNRFTVFLNWIWAYIVKNHGARVITGTSRKKDEPRPT
jgi:NADH dehydrogenase